MMKNIITIFSLFLAFSFNGFSQTAGPKIEFKSNVVDYGEIIKGSDGIRIFTFINSGDMPLEITKVYSSCGCTIPKKPEAPVIAILKFSFLNNLEYLNPFRKLF